MPLALSHVTSLLETLAPLAHAEPWDNVGLLVDPGVDRRDRTKPPEVHKVLLCVDLTDEVLAEATEREVDLIVSYHPPLFEPVKRLRHSVPAERIVLGASRAGIAVYSPHTALDAAPGGVNDWLADGLGAGERAPLSSEPGSAAPDLKSVVFVPAANVVALRGALSAVGAGVIGEYSECSFELPGTGTFVPGPTANPSVGKRGKLERASEVRLEMVCPRAALGLVATVIEQVHPYEEPAWDVYP